MKFLNTVASLVLATAGLSQASPLKSRQAPQNFALETQVLNSTNDCGSNKGGLYIFSYHTGAGQGIAAGDASPSSGSYFYLNDTTLLWSYEGNEIGPWKTEILYGPYQGKLSCSFLSTTLLTCDQPTTQSPSASQRTIQLQRASTSMETSSSRMPPRTVGWSATPGIRLLSFSPSMDPTTANSRLLAPRFSSWLSQSLKGWVREPRLDVGIRA